MICTNIRSALKPFCIFVSYCIFVPITLIAQGDLMIYPKRIIFEGTKRTEQLSLSNIGADTARYVISVIQIRMTEDGSFETITEPDSGQNFADKYIRYFPRNVVLAPHEAQAVKLQLVNTNNLKAGEYRSHMYLRAQAEGNPLGEESLKSDSSISVRLIPIFGISIPLIIRVGEPTLEMQLAKASFLFENDTVPVLKMDLIRSGNISFYGDISVDYISPKGKTIRLALATGIALYTPTHIRHFKVQLDKIAGVDFHAGSLLISCTDRALKGFMSIQQQINLQ